MKILYAAFRHDPTDPDSASGSHYQFYQAALDAGCDVRVIGPFNKLPPIFIERMLKGLYRRFSDWRYNKYDWTNTWRASQELNQASTAWNPDVIFVMAPPPLVFYSGSIPAVFRTDTTFLGMHRQAPEYLRHGPMMLAQMAWQERQAFRRCARVITHSEWSSRVLVDEYALPAEKVAVFPNPAALPEAIVPPFMDLPVSKNLAGPLRLLLVGRDYQRKGIDLAIEVVERLNAGGIPAQLTVVGSEGQAGSFHQFVGSYCKSDPRQLEAYAARYHWAHLLIHPARFEAAGIVPSEAAAFGVPTITNAAGGLATTVKDGESGVVLPIHSPPGAYVCAIEDLVAHPEKYYALCTSTRARYERELNWKAAGKRFYQILEEAAGYKFKTVNSKL